MTAAHRLENAERDVTAFARAIALKRAAILAVAALVLGLAVSRHWITPELSARATSWVEGGIGFAATVGAGAWIHSGTTPADSALQPRNTAGQDLVPDPSVGDAVAIEDTDSELAAAVTGNPAVPATGAGMVEAIVAADAAAPDQPAIDPSRFNPSGATALARAPISTLIVTETPA